MRRKGVIVAIVSMVLLFGCGGGGNDSDSKNNNQPKIYHIAYSVDSFLTLTATADVSYQYLYGQWRKSDVKLPWSFTFDAQSGDYVYLSASDPILSSFGNFLKIKHPNLCVGIFLNGVEWKSICCDSDPNIPCDSIFIDGTLE